MPHRGRPIPRYNAPTSVQSPIDPLVSAQPRRERETTAPRHRAGSLHTQPGHGSDPSPSLMPNISQNAPSNAPEPRTRSGGGRSSGRALPPPRFQRKQRPPRVQQAMAASNASSQSLSTNPHSHSHGRGRRATNNNANADPNVTGTLTLGPANNWGAGTSSVVSLPMSAINAAAARASVIHQQRQQQQQPLPSHLPQPKPSASSKILDVGNTSHFDAEIMNLRGLDPVQLHNKLTFGMGHGDPFLSQDHPHAFNALDHDTFDPPLHPHPAPYIGPSIISNRVVPSSSMSPSNPRQRSKLRNQADPSIPSSSSTSTLDQQGYPAPSSSDSQDRYSTLDPPFLDQGPYLHSRRKSLMAPADTPSPILRPPAFAVGALPPLPSQACAPTANTPASSSAPRLTFDTRGFDNDTAARSSPLDNATSYSTTRRPLKSALKVRKSAPELVDTPLADAFDSTNYPSFDSSQYPSIRSDLYNPRYQASPLEQQTSLARHPSSAAIAHEPLLPDPNFTLPDSLQAQYAYQLRLLQQEYADKAARAEAIRKGTEGGRRDEVAHGREDNTFPDVGRTTTPHIVGLDSDVPEHNGRFDGSLLGDRESMVDMTPPSSGGGSGSGYRVSFQEGIDVIRDPATPSATESVAYEADEGNEDEYTIWDGEWAQGELENAPEESVEQVDDGEEEEEEGYAYTFGDGFGSLDSAPQEAPRASLLPVPEVQHPSTADDGLEYDERSDIGDRGHEDKNGDQLDHGETFSPTDSLSSLTRAVYHGHEVEESPTVSSVVNRKDILKRVQESERGSGSEPDDKGEEALFIPPVEIIAPTPTLPTLELGDSFEPQILKPLEGVEDKVEKARRTSEDSSGHKNSEENSSGSTESNVTVQRQLQDTSPISIETTTPISQPAVTMSPSILVRRSPEASEPAFRMPGSFPEDAPSSTVQFLSSAEIQLPPPLQRLAKRLSRGSTIVPPAAAIQPPTPSQQEPSALHRQPAFSVGSGFEQQQLTASSSFTPSTATNTPASAPFASSSSLRTSSSHESYRPDNSRRRSTQQSLSHQMLPPQQDSSTIGVPHPTSHPMRQRNPSLRSLVHAEDINSQLPHPHSALQYSYTQSPTTRPRHSSLIFAELSSAASAESGSSHGGGTSGASHIHPFGHPLLAPSHHSLNRMLDSGLRITQSSSALSPPLASSRLPRHATASNEGGEEDRLFNVKSSESLRAASIASGKSAGSTGSSKGRLGLGGESIWTLKEDEDAAWLSGPPSSSGHPLAVAKNPSQWTLQSILSDNASLSLSSEGRSHLEEAMYPDDIHGPGYMNTASHPYRAFTTGHPNDSASSLHSSGPSFVDAPAAHPLTRPPQNTFGQSRSTSALPVSSGDASNESFDPRPIAPDTERLRAMRVAPVRPQGGSYTNPPSLNHNRLRSLPQSRSAPNFEPESHIYADGMAPLSYYHPTTAGHLSRASMTSGLVQSSYNNTVPLPPTGGVFPRIQEISASGGDGARGGGAGNGRFKGLFKNRDSRVFK